MSSLHEKPMVYLAGPYTNPDPVMNTHDTLRLGMELYETGLITPYVPHVSLLWHMVTPRPYQLWLDYDIELLERCDALLRIPGESFGADDEVRFAEDVMNIPIFWTTEDLIVWAKGWNK